MIYTDFPLDLTGFFFGKHAIQFLLTRCGIFGISFCMTALSFLTQNKLKIQATNFKNNEATANFKIQTLLKKISLSRILK